MNDVLAGIKTKIYDKCSLQITDFLNEAESKEYAACRFALNGINVVCRNAKITPKKTGQFVTFWKRDENGTTSPLDGNDPFDFYLINVAKENRLGQFIIPKSILIDKGIVSTHKKEGKRGFRVYPSWDTVTNKQAEKTQKWQLDFFVEFEANADLERVYDLLNR